MTKGELIAICANTKSCEICENKHDCDNFMEEMPSSPAYYIRIIKHIETDTVRKLIWIDDVIQEHFV